MDLEPDFAGKVALVVGGYGCIGSAVSRTLAACDCHVVVAGRQRDRAEGLAHEIEAAHGRASAIELDADDVPAMRRSVSEVWARLRGIDFLINCIGRQQEQLLADVTEEGFDAVLRTNLKAAMFLGQAVALHQIARERGGKHVHLLSLRATLGYRGRGYSAFTSSKGGLAALIRQHAAELAPSGVTVNGIAPGIVRTPKNAEQIANPETLRRMLEPIPLGRLAEPADVARVATLLCSTAFDFMTGQILYLDGGMTSCR
jgi:NAD(P)-dependent dehydrogenase (short-subunit alcohol dehydrogenase family)